MLSERERDRAAARPSASRLFDTILHKTSPFRRAYFTSFGGSCAELTVREVALRAISLALPLVSKLPDGLGGDANPCVCFANAVSVNDTAAKKERVALCAPLLTVREFRLRRIFLLVASPSELGSALLAKCEPMRLLCKPYGNRCFADAKRRVLLDG